MMCAVDDTSKSDLVASPPVTFLFALIIECSVAVMLVTMVSYTGRRMQYTGTRL